MKCFRSFMLFLSCLVSVVLYFNVANAAEATEVTVKSDFMEVYTGAGRGYPVFFVVEKNEKFKLLKRKVDWIKIESGLGQIGWISMNDYALAVNRTRFLPKVHAIKSKWELGFSAGIFGSDQTMSASAGYYVTPKVTLLTEVKRVVGLYSYSSMASANIMFQRYRHQIISPFVNFGIGRMNNIPRESLVSGNKGYGGFYLVGGGVNYIPYKRMNLRLTLNNYYLDKLEQSYIDVRIGLYALFG